MWQRINKIILFISLMLFAQYTSSAQFTAGDIAPRSAPDSTLNVVDFLLLQRIVLGYETPTATESLIADVAPLGNPDGQIDANGL